MARDVLMERRVAQAGTLQARSTAVDTEAWNARPTQRHTLNDVNFDFGRWGFFTGLIYDTVCECTFQNPQYRASYRPRSPD